MKKKHFSLLCWQFGLFRVPNDYFPKSPFKILNTEETESLSQHRYQKSKKKLDNYSQGYKHRHRHTDLATTKLNGPWADSVIKGFLGFQYQQNTLRPEVSSSLGSNCKRRGIYSRLNHPRGQFSKTYIIQVTDTVCDLIYLIDPAKEKQLQILKV